MFKINVFYDLIDCLIVFKRFHCVFNGLHCILKSINLTMQIFFNKNLIFNIPANEEIEKVIIVPTRKDSRSKEINHITNA